MKKIVLWVKNYVADFKEGLQLMRERIACARMCKEGENRIFT
jgi:hypothetical protein